MFFQFPVRVRDGKLGKLCRDMRRRTEEEARVGLAQHGRIVVGVAGCEDAKLKSFESRHCMFLLIRLPEMIVEDSTVVIDFELIAEESGIA